jgi:hypothetical protein
MASSCSAAEEFAEVALSAAGEPSDHRYHRRLPRCAIVSRQKAAARRAADIKAARRGRGDAYSEYWCVFDIDEHPNVARALELAASSGVSVCATNPCVELWFLLHFQDQSAAIHRHDAQRKASEYLNSGKSPTSAALAALTGQYEDARRRAQALRHAAG